MIAKCHFPSCQDRGIETHHITYEPEVTVVLCKKHHEDITIINGQQARKFSTPYYADSDLFEEQPIGSVATQLSNKHRWWIWYRWLEGKLKPRRTRKALEYLQS